MFRGCPCGSGLYREDNYDARGIFLAFTCDACHERKMGAYRSDVVVDPCYWHDEPINEE